jgi:hypothetical protein
LTRGIAGLALDDGKSTENPGSFKTMLKNHRMAFEASSNHWKITITVMPGGQQSGDRMILRSSEIQFEDGRPFLLLG